MSLRELVVAVLRERLGANADVLDAGCGTGALLTALPPSWRRTGVDIEEDALALVPRAAGVTVRQADVAQLPFGDASVDAVVSLDVLYHESVDQCAALREFRRVLRPGGVVVLNLPAYEWLRSGHDVAARTARRYRASQVRSLLRDAGFRPERVGYRLMFLFPPAAARRLLTRGGGGTDVGPVPPTLNAVLLAVMRFENRLVRRLVLPFGLSVFAIARAPR